jgi:spore coat protein E
MSIPDKDVQRREIITKAVCGKGRKFSQVSHNVTPPHAPTSILGAWIINNQYEAAKSSDGVEVVGTYDINIWYSHDKNTKTDVAKETISYVDVVPLNFFDKNYRAATAEVTAAAVQEPNCVEASISSRGDGVVIRVEREFQVEVTAETKMVVYVSPHGIDEEEYKNYDFDAGDEGSYEEADLDLIDDEFS